MDYLLDRGQTLPILSADEQWLSTKKSERLKCRHFYKLQTALNYLLYSKIKG
jgi:hypothetical protein